MAPERPPKLAVVDLRFEANILKANVNYIEVLHADKRLRVRWNEEKAAPTFFPVSGGVVYVEADDYVIEVPQSENASPSGLGNSRYRWSEGLDPLQPWIMFVLILPENYTISNPNPLPKEAKAFNGRLALYWVVRGDLLGRVEVQWNLTVLQGELSQEVEQINIGNHDQPISHEAGIDIEVTQQENDTSDQSNVEPLRIYNNAPPTPQKKQMALIMKGGGVKGLAYIGALRELEKYYHFDWFVGTSAGAIAAVLLAAGYTVDELEDILVKQNFREFCDAKPHKWLTNLFFYNGLFPAYTFTNWIDNLLARKLESPVRVSLCKLPKRITIYASRRGMKALIFDSENAESANKSAAFAVRCSMAIPFVFTPEQDEGMRVLDGGMRNNYPVDILMGSHPDIDFIGLYLGPEYFEGIAGKSSLLKDMFSIWAEAADQDALKKYQAQTIIIDPRPISTIDFSLTEEEKRFLIMAGKAAALKYLYKLGVSSDITEAMVETTRSEVETARSKIKTTRTIRKFDRFTHFLKTVTFLLVLLLLFKIITTPAVTFISIQSESYVPRITTKIYGNNLGIDLHQEIWLYVSNSNGNISFIRKTQRPDNYTWQINDVIISPISNDDSNRYVIGIIATNPEDQDILTNLALRGDELPNNLEPLIQVPVTRNRNIPTIIIGSGCTPATYNTLQNDLAQNNLAILSTQNKAQTKITLSCSNNQEMITIEIPKQPDEQIMFLDEAPILTATLNIGQARALVTASLLYANGNYGSTVDLLNQGGLSTIAVAQLLLAQSYIHLERWEEARGAYKSTLDLLHESETELRARALSGQGLAYILEDEVRRPDDQETHNRCIEHAWNNFNQAVLLEPHRSLWRSGRALATLRCPQSDNTNIYSDIKRALELSQGTRTTEEAIALSLLADYIAKEEEDLLTSRTYAEQAKTIAEHLPLPYRVLSCISSLEGAAETSHSLYQQYIDRLVLLQQRRLAEQRMASDHYCI